MHSKSGFYAVKLGQPEIVGDIQEGRVTLFFRDGERCTYEYEMDLDSATFLRDNISSMVEDVRQYADSAETE